MNSAATRGLIGAAAGAAIGAYTDDENRLRGAAVGGATGAFLGAVHGHRADKDRIEDTYQRPYHTRGPSNDDLKTVKGKTVETKSAAWFDLAWK